MIECFKHQDYPHDRIEWIVVDDGTDPIGDLIEAAHIPQIRYFYSKEKMVLGKKRNYMHSQCKGEIIVYMDDDDYYPPERISHAVEELMKHRNVLCAGASEIYVFFKNESHRMVQFGPYNPYHASAGTFAFRRELLNITQYNDEKALAEEKEFLKNYTIPMIQLNPLKTILVFSHNHNTFDKRKLLKQTHPQLMRDSEKKVQDFIRNSRDSEKGIFDFFMHEIDALLEAYEYGKPSYKPDVLQQMKTMEQERQQILENMRQNQPQQQCIYLEQPGKPRVELTLQEIVDIIQTQNQQLQKQSQLIEELQQNRIVMQRNGHEEPISMTHQQIIEHIQQQQRIIDCLKKRIVELTPSAVKN